MPDVGPAQPRLAVLWLAPAEGAPMPPRPRLWYRRRLRRPKPFLVRPDGKWDDFVLSYFSSVEEARKFRCAAGPESA